MTNRRVSPVFVGREAEIETLAGALGEAAAGRPQVVLVGAEAGGGKSRLVSELAEPGSPRPSAPRSDHRAATLTGILPAT